MATDCELILMHIKKYGSITHDEAAGYGIKRLAARIYDLRDKGYNIKTDMVSCKNRRGRISNFARYSLAEAAE